MMMTRPDRTADIRPFRLNPQAEPEPLPPYIPAGTYRPGFVPDPALAQFLRGFVYALASPQKQKEDARVQRLAVVQGPGGVGKSETTKHVLSEAGYNVTIMPAASFAGDTANAGAARLEQVLRGCSAISLSTRLPHVFISEDADLSSWVTRERREYTVDSDLITNVWHFGCDNRDHYLDVNGFPIGLIMIGNDFRGLRETLRQRAVFFTFNPTWRETAARFEQILAPRSTYQRHRLRALVRRHKTEPLRFFVDCASAVNDRALEQHIGTSGPLDIAAIDRALIAARQAKLNLRELSRVAKQRAADRPRNFIAEWR
jgi:hypothetical protein